MKGSSMYKITLLAGDGIGPEITESVKKLLEFIKEHYQFNLEIVEADFGGISIDNQGVPLTDSTLEKCQNSDAIFLGAIGGEKWAHSSDNSPESGLLELRKKLNLYTNIRPIKVFNDLIELSPIKAHLLEDVDFTIFRELTAGIYFGEKTKTNDSASDLCEYHRHEIERITRAACDFAISNQCKKITLVDKANVLETSRLWRSVVTKLINESYPNLQLEFQLVDSAAMKLITAPKDFEVILTENMFGDILSDEASVLTGSIGMLPSASMSDNRFALYEPIHGSAPDIAGKNIANPYASILSIAMMFQITFQRNDIHDDIVNSVQACLKKKFLTKDLNQEHFYTTREITDLFLSELVEIENLVVN